MPCDVEGKKRFGVQLPPRGIIARVMRSWPVQRTSVFWPIVALPFCGTIFPWKSGCWVSDSSIKNIFISYVHEDDEGLGETKALLEQNGMTLRDGSINPEKPNEAKSSRYIRLESRAPRIRWAEVCTVYIPRATKSSAWLKWQIEYAQRDRKAQSRDGDEREPSSALQNFHVRGGSGVVPPEF